MPNRNPLNLAKNYSIPFFFFFFFNKVYESFLNLSCHKQLKIAKGRGSEDSWAQQHHKDNKKKHWIITQKGCKTPNDQYRNMLFTAAMHNYKHDWTLNEEPSWNPDCILASSVGSSIRLSGYGRIELQPVANKSKRFKRETQKPCLSTRWNNFVTSITTYKK